MAATTPDSPKPSPKKSRGKKTPARKGAVAGASRLTVARLSKMAAPYNPRKEMAPHAFAALRRAITEVGIGSPITLNRRTQAKGWPKGSRPVIVGGHQRVKAAAAEGIPEFDVFWVDLSRDDEELMNLGLNQISGRFDDEDLENMLREMRDRGVELSLAGFDDPELKRRLQMISQGKRDPDALPNRVQKRVKAGEIWKLGKHFLVCGDSTDSNVLETLFGQGPDEDRPNLCMTDPPYGVDYDPEWRNTLDTSAPRRTGKVPNDDRADWGDVWRICGCDVIYSWSASGGLQLQSGSALERAGYEIRAQIIWSKNNFPISRGHYTMRHEPCWYAVKKGSKAEWIGDKKQCSVWEANQDPSAPGGHSTQKPVALFTHSIGNHDGNVFEPFAGSGTCLIACEQLDRRCYAIELDEHYCNSILARWEEFTGEKASKVGKVQAAGKAA